MNSLCRRLRDVRMPVRSRPDCLIFSSVCFGSCQIQNLISITCVQLCQMRHEIALKLVAPLRLHNIYSSPSEAFPLATVPPRAANTMANPLTPTAPHPGGVAVIKRWHCDIGRPGREWAIDSKGQAGAPHIAAARSARTRVSILIKCCASRHGARLQPPFFSSPLSQ